MTDVELAIGTRERSYRWGDPLVGASVAPTMDGLSYLQAMLRGELPHPPILDTLDFELESVEVGSVVFRLRPAEFHYNPIGSVHGGVYATLLDSAAGCAVHTTLPARAWYTSLDLNVKFLRRVTVDTGTVRCEGRIVHLGGRTALARAELIDGAGTLLAEATSSCLITRGG
ncbi:PaaI family thioesterase [Pseudonocardia bannensis]|uniref:PaaI family thioesterase n=1 Tax=Pseudonocardia bannensis TaxID=630973 RepID=A0A848DNU9_9PSEU|nr:PaaI family thioesterase [Pseudonocardia bannensis]NMH94189.1 PaaI family thioesterase [Pseudonocardia bannensis]